MLKSSSNVIGVELQVKKTFHFCSKSYNDIGFFQLIIASLFLLANEDEAREELPPLKEIRDRCIKQLENMRPDHMRRLNPTPYKVWFFSPTNCLKNHVSVF